MCVHARVCHSFDLRGRNDRSPELRLSSRTFPGTRYSIKKPPRLTNFGIRLSPKSLSIFLFPSWWVGWCRRRMISRTVNVYTPQLIVSVSELCFSTRFGGGRDVVVDSTSRPNKTSLCPSTSIRVFLPPHTTSSERVNFIQKFVLQGICTLLTCDFSCYFIF